MTRSAADVPRMPPDGDAVEVDPAVAPDVHAALELVRTNALELLSGFSRAPSVLRIRAGGVTVEAEWPVEQAAPPVGGGSAAAAVVAAPTAPPTSTEPVGHRVRAPAVGVLFHAPSPGAEPFVSVGDAVAPDQQLAIIEVMKLMIPVRSAVHGTVTAVLTDNGEPVEYDQPLFLIDTGNGDG